MATYSVSRSKTATLTASTVDTVTITDGSLHTIEVVNLDASSRISFTIDGATPTADGDNCVCVPPGSATAVYDGNDAATVVRLISAGAPTYVVWGY